MSLKRHSYLVSRISIMSFWFQVSCLKELGWIYETRNSKLLTERSEDKQVGDG